MDDQGLAQFIEALIAFLPTFISIFMLVAGIVIAFRITAWIGDMVLRALNTEKKLPPPTALPSPSLYERIKNLNMAMLALADWLWYGAEPDQKPKRKEKPKRTIETVDGESLEVVEETDHDTA